jgi:hypothetical protein
MDLQTGNNDDEETRYSSAASTSTSQASHQVNVAVVTPSKRPVKKKNVAKKKYKMKRVERRLVMTDMSGVSPVVCCLCKELAAQDLFLFCNL